MERKPNNSSETKRRSNDAVRCPICGKEVLACRDGSDIDVRCRECNAQLTIMRKNDTLVVRETHAHYKP